MGCEARLPDLHALVDGELPAGAEDALRRHLGSCAPCRDALLSLERADAALRVRAPHPSPALAARIVERVLSREERPSRLPALLVVAVALVWCYPVATLLSSTPFEIDTTWLGLLAEKSQQLFDSALTAAPLPSRGTGPGLLAWLAGILALQAAASLLLLRRRESA